MIKFYPGCYRIPCGLSFTAYGHIRRVNGMWNASIHHETSGDILRHAGRWNTLHEAASECRHILWRDYPVATVHPWM